MRIPVDIRAFLFNIARTHWLWLMTTIRERTNIGKDRPRRRSLPALRPRHGLSASGNASSDVIVSLVSRETLKPGRETSLAY